jgi:3-polyprenyl-4-hydroxybenzoate decarboxylase
MRHVSSRIARTAAMLAVLAIGTHSFAADLAKEHQRLTIRQIVKQFVIRALDQLGCPPG